MKNKKRIFKLLSIVLMLGLSLGIYSRYDEIHESLQNGNNINSEIKENIAWQLSISLSGLQANINEVSDSSSYILTNKVKEIKITPHFQSVSEDEIKKVEDHVKDEIVNMTTNYANDITNDKNIEYWIRDDKTGKEMFSNASLKDINFENIPATSYRLLGILQFNEQGMIKQSKWIHNNQTTDFFTSDFTSRRMLNGSYYTTEATYYDSKSDHQYSVEVNLNFPKNLTCVIAVQQDLVPHGILKSQSYYDQYMYNYTFYVLPYLLFGLGIMALFMLLSPLEIVETCQPYRALRNCKLEIWLPICAFIGFYLFHGILGLVTVTSNGVFSETLELFGFNNFANPIMILCNAGLWMLIFGLVKYVVFMIKYIFHTGFKKYFLENTVLCWFARLCKQMLFPKAKLMAHRLISFLRKIKNNIKAIYIKLKNKILGIKNFDLKNKNNRYLISVVLINLAILMFVSFLNIFGWVVAIFYSIALFVYIWHCYGKINQDYNKLLNSTQQLSKGCFDIKFDQDLGIFNSLGQSFTSIKDGFEKAVQEEVKSQRMKTELISNVSHDLKTPLTSIITYVDLLKNENLSIEERKKYIDTLDRNSLRLKTLIEDLFEISKATSGNINLNLMDVDIVSLISQAQFECMDRIQEMGLDFRTHFSQDKIIYHLDSSKTYRIFENLLVNICKYALPHTRVYIDVIEKNEDVTITFKNISANEIDFEVDEIVERFVQGDKSRNANGSGLGLAIAKSFTELQGGTFKIEVDGDLFKAIVKFRKSNQESR